MLSTRVFQAWRGPCHGVAPVNSSRRANQFPEQVRNCNVKSTQNSPINFAIYSCDYWYYCLNQKRPSMKLTVFFLPKQLIQPCCGKQVDAKQLENKNISSRSYPVQPLQVENMHPNYPWPRFLAEFALTSHPHSIIEEGVCGFHNQPTDTGECQNECIRGDPNVEPLKAFLFPHVWLQLFGAKPNTSNMNLSPDFQIEQRCRIGA